MSAWLIEVIERLGVPVDLVGHDWGCLLVVRVGEEWEADVARIGRPALVLWSRDDPYVAPRFAERLAARVHGELVFLEGCGHWWPLERPAEAAAALERFWRGPA